MDKETIKQRMEQLAQLTGLQFDGGLDDQRLFLEENINVFANDMTEKEYFEMQKQIDSFELKGQGFEVFCWNDSSSYDYWYEEGLTDCSNYIMVTVLVTDLEKFDHKAALDAANEAFDNLSVWDNSEYHTFRAMDREENIKNKRLETFIESYLEAALTLFDDYENETTDSDHCHSFTDIAPESMEKIREECTEFFNKYKDYWDTDSTLFYYDSQAGNDFLLTRNGHGTGFWDRKEIKEEYQTILTDRAQSFGQCDLYIGDDNLVYQF